MKSKKKQRTTAKVKMMNVESASFSSRITCVALFFPKHKTTHRVNKKNKKKRKIQHVREFYVCAWALFNTYKARRKKAWRRTRHRCTKTNGSCVIHTHTHRLGASEKHSWGDARTRSSSTATERVERHHPPYAEKEEVEGSLGSKRARERERGIGKAIYQPLLLVLFLVVVSSPY